MNDLIRLKRTHVKLASEMMARTFMSEPVYVYFLPDAPKRSRVLHYHFALRLRYALSYGEVHATSPNLEGIAIWFPPDYPRMTPGTSILNGGLSVLFHMGMKSVSRQLSVHNFLQSEQATSTPFRHWYLSALGVDPVYQGKGYASKLLKPMLARLDEDKLPCYLDTQRKTNLPLYQRFGFGVVKESVIPQSSIKTWAMLRKY